MALDSRDLRSHAWYHGPIPRQRAEEFLRNDGDFLVRDCVSQPGNYVLSCRAKGQILHFVINKVKNFLNRNLSRWKNNPGLILRSLCSPQNIKNLLNEHNLNFFQAFIITLFFPHFILIMTLAQKNISTIRTFYIFEWGSFTAGAHNDCKILKFHFFSLFADDFPTESNEMLNKSCEKEKCVFCCIALGNK